MLITVTVLLAAISLAVLAVVMAYILGWANQVFHVEVDPKVERILNALPGSNCGGCGFVGCGEYAEAVAREEADLTLCAPGGAGCAVKLGEIMGVKVSDTLPYKAVVHCAAYQGMRLQQTEYRGERTCEAANLVSGIQGCTYGCLGLGDCVTACDYDAIHIRDGLAVVSYDKCVGCKACAVVCPRNIITMTPFKTERILVVACSNEDFGQDVKKVCKVGCIGCKACTRIGELMKMEGNIPVINYEDYDPESDLDAILDKCKMESLIYVGKPTEKDIALLGDEQAPDRVTADFETTVDHTEWRG